MWPLCDSEDVKEKIQNRKQEKLQPTRATLIQNKSLDRINKKKTTGDLYFDGVLFFWRHERLFIWAQGFSSGDHVLLLGSANALCSKASHMLNLPEDG